MSRCRQAVLPGDGRALPPLRIHASPRSRPRPGRAPLASRAGALHARSPGRAVRQFHLAEGCPAHCQYCHLAGSLSGPPVTRVFANLPALLERTRAFERRGQVTSFEVSCYTDPLALEHLTGALSACVRHFAAREGAHLRFVTKFDATGPLERLAHAGRTRARFSVSVPAVERLEGGTAPVVARLQAAARLAQAGYPVGLVVAPVMPVPG